MQEKNHAAKKDLKFLKEYSSIVSERAKPLELGSANKEIQKISRKRSEGGDKLVKAATILLICPDPVTGAAAMPLLAAAAIKSKRNKKSDLQRVYESMNEITTSLSSAGLSL